MTTSLSSSSSSVPALPSPSSFFAFLLLLFLPKFSMPSGPIRITLRVTNGSSGVPDPETEVLSDSADPPNKSANVSPMPLPSSSLPFSPLESSEPPNKSLKLIILPIIPSAPPSPLEDDFLGSSSFGCGMPKAALASRPSKDDGIEDELPDEDGRLDVPSPFNLLRVIPSFLLLDPSPTLDLLSFDSSYNTIPGSAFIASFAAVVSGCQLA
mmetsp:Transcript_34622/g.73006  ORF Transcript_34622/g.73006 Transcript_34622/m.73006 type:complete len:211 (-) Transcript_34622:1615-2247(-)